MAVLRFSPGQVRIDQNQCDSENQDSHRIHVHPPFVCSTRIVRHEYSILTLRQCYPIVTKMLTLLAAGSAEVFGDEATSAQTPRIRGYSS